MGKSKGGRSLNPADAARKKTRLREKEKVRRTSSIPLPSFPSLGQLYYFRFFYSDVTLTLLSECSTAA
jgi:hypothetical protein